MMKKIISLIAMLVALSGIAHAEGRPAILADVQPRSGTVGDVLTYTAKITWPEGLQVIPPEPPENLGDCELLDRSVGDLANEQGIFTLDVSMTLACYKSGQQTIPGLKVSFTDSQGESRTEQGPELTVNILRTLPEEAKEIKGIKGQQEVAPDYITPLLISAAALVVALLIFFVFSRFRRAKKRKQALSIKPPDPYPYAVERFESGTLEKLLETDDLPGYYTELTDILREYLEGRLDVRALEMTTTEIQRALKDVPIDGFLKTDLRGILERADFAKFASIFPTGEQCGADLQKGREFVEKTRPEPIVEGNGKAKEGAA